ncbi:MAG: hypothetical protein SO116_03575 [Treponema sp.]|nr:hypothetical protein [Spirochaetales bacterium]MDY4901930.1 hypothetical protein [Treponema sp.]
MERHIFKLALFALIFSLKTIFAYSQAPSEREQLRICVWADLDPFPGQFSVNEEDFSQKEELPENKSADKTESEKAGNYTEKEKMFHLLFDFAIDRTKETAPFLISGMLSGWEFEYTPLDKSRNVEEFWSFKEVEPFNPDINHLTFHYPEVSGNKLISWVYCDRTKEQIRSYDMWNSIVHSKIHGNGSGSVEDGFEGIKEACSNAVKNAVREYWRTMIKNKPKEISGKVLLTGNPRIYIKEGKYIVDLDFFLETDRIVPYRYY